MPSASGKPGPDFEIDPGKLAEEARYDCLFVLRTNARITPLQAVLRYRAGAMPAAWKTLPTWPAQRRGW